LGEKQKGFEGEKKDAKGMFLRTPAANPSFSAKIKSPPFGGLFVMG